MLRAHNVVKSAVVTLIVLTLSCPTKAFVIGHFQDQISNVLESGIIKPLMDVLWWRETEVKRTDDSIVPIPEDLPREDKALKDTNADGEKDKKTFLSQIFGTDKKDDKNSKIGSLLNFFQNLSASKLVTRALGFKFRKNGNGNDKDENNDGDKDDKIQAAIVIKEASKPVTDIVVGGATSIVTNALTYNFLGIRQNIKKFSLQALENADKDFREIASTVASGVAEINKKIGEKIYKQLRHAAERKWDLAKEKFKKAKDYVKEHAFSGIQEFIKETYNNTIKVKLNKKIDILKSLFKIDDKLSKKLDILMGLFKIDNRLTNNDDDDADNDDDNRRPVIILEADTRGGSCHSDIS